MSDVLEKMEQSLISGQLDAVVELTKQALEQELSATVIMNKGLLSGMSIVGKRFKSGEMFMPEVLMCAQAMHGSMDILRPLLADAKDLNTGTLVLGTVKGDLHDIGKDLVKMMFKGAGFNVVDMGVDVQAQAFVDAVKKHDPDIVGLSALLTTTMPMMADTVTALKDAGVLGKAKVIVGGAPVTQAYADSIGADAYGVDAVSAVEVAKALMT